MAYFVQLVPGSISRANTISAAVGEESGQFALIVEPSDPRGTWPWLPDSSLADVEIVDARDARALPPGFDASRDTIFTVTGKQPGSGAVNAMDMLETRIGPPNTVYGSVSLSVKDVPAADRDVDLFYSGRRIMWRKSLPPSAQGKGPLIFDATSGLTQIAKFQTTKDSGPIPEGTYTFLAQIDSKQSSVAQANALGDDAVANVRHGIQYLPVGGLGPTQPQWGTHRVRLSRSGSSKAPDRDGFYLHDSYKGYSHGCVEVGDSEEGKAFFDYLIEYATSSKSKQKAWLILKVLYHDADASTLGKTKRT